MDKNKERYSDLEEYDVESDCAIIGRIHPIPSDISNELPTKDLRFSSVESGYGSVNPSLDSGLCSDLEKLKITPINELSEGSHRTTSTLYDEAKSEKQTVERLSDSEKEYKSREIDQNEELLLEIFKPDKDGDSQLHMAIIQMLSPITLYFISLIPSFHWLNLPNNLLQVPLHLAAITRQADVVRKLMAAGADIVARDYKGDTALHIACREGYDDIVEILLTPVQYNETTDVRYPLQRQNIPQDTQLMNYNGQSCLHLAAERCHLPILRLLLQNGANINIKDGKCGKTILHYAAETRNNVLLEFLLTQQGLDLNATTYGGLTPVQLADGRGFSNVVTTLRHHGAIYTPVPVEENDSEEEMSE